MKTLTICLWALLSILFIGCEQTGDDDDDVADDDTGDDDTSGWEPPEGGAIELETRDGVMLEGDYYPSETYGASGVILLHMYAVYYDRTGWPADFIGHLGDHGWAVIVPDRRGAGNSEGDPEESWDGEKGKWDVEVCATRLRDDGYGDLAIIGASNGTTSMIDYAVWAPDEGLPEPVALGYMTGGNYTEANEGMEDVPPVPAIFTYSTDEAAWSVSQQALDPGNWQFNEYDGGDHGTLMFDAKPEVDDDLNAFLETVLPDA